MFRVRVGGDRPRGLARGAENMVFLAGQCFCFAAVVYFEDGLLETFSR